MVPYSPGYGDHSGITLPTLRGLVMKIIILRTSDLVHLSSIENVLPRGVGHTVRKRGGGVALA